MDLKHYRNFSIIAHIDHGKSTLSDRLLDLTGTIEKRKMREQVLDSMELERERGITIKMQPVRMNYKLAGEDYILNLIDTPGHIDFSYEVSRSLQAVEGVLLLVDATQGVQAQTFTVLAMAQELGLTIIPVLNKIDLPIARTAEVKQEIVNLLKCQPEDIMAVSGKTGEGVDKLLIEIIKKIPSPISEIKVVKPCRALVFDFEYSIHKGVVVYVRVLDGEITPADQLNFVASGEKFSVLELGYFRPQAEPQKKLQAGDIGYLVTGIKKPGNAKVGDTITTLVSPLPAVPGYMTPRPVVWASLYPASQDDFALLKQSLERLNLQDAALSFEEESSGALGRGFRAGFLGMLHLEIISERLKREFSLNLIVTTPSISYRLINTRTKEEVRIFSPHLFPLEIKDYEIYESWVAVRIISPADYLSPIIQLLHEHEAEVMTMETFSSSRTALSILMPLRELMRNFFDSLKSVSSGFASFSYELAEERLADVSRLDILINGEIIPAFSRIVSRRRIEKDASEMAERLEGLIPKQLITIKIQVQGLGRILAARSISALRKDVTDYLYGGDITRKMKLREKQKKGKKKMQQLGKVNIPQEVFLKMMRNAD
ncbi:MAG: elongation factor 4 [Candidatus Vogelbacteria bacterium CG22_combo_CG10-13_8_21_14_all_37_9]|uniref:Elongation factor 4 n=1 Tax=Candidatus Vogelbacteria bacterium CG22_combo_CG10-13_8_21_14_all_37_9 TaxID=1975046 RepID=A0A2H0BL36_9BACT|nr:MAG: elongation factor 4 [bacterium CG10_37_50]PIP58314.1 MAG: elongation factor 4 [Candidatus Vogelbacteria bacterium CG22_combo_CG10-13_8_21_14_all_37_9]